MAVFNKTYNTKADLVTAIGTRDYFEFQTDEIFDGVQRRYLYIPSLNATYGERNNGSYRLATFGEISLNQ